MFCLVVLGGISSTNLHPLNCMCDWVQPTSAYFFGSVKSSIGLKTNNGALRFSVKFNLAVICKFIR